MELTDERLIEIVAGIGGCFDDLALHYQTDSVIAGLRAVIAADRKLRENSEAEGLVLTSSDVASLICRYVAELPDRSSPPEWPAAMLVTQNELYSIVDRKSVV